MVHTQSRVTPTAAANATATRIKASSLINSNRLTAQKGKITDRNRRQNRDRNIRKKVKGDKENSNTHPLTHPLTPKHEQRAQLGG